MRGKADGFHEKFGDLGITPAYAGKSISQWHRPYVCKDHPRLCGEKDRVKHCGSMLMGSPPPMRGKVKSHIM